MKAYHRKANVLKAMGQTKNAMDDPNSDEAKNGYKDCAIQMQRGRWWISSQGRQSTRTDQEVVKHGEPKEVLTGM